MTAEGFKQGIGYGQLGLVCLRKCSHFIHTSLPPPVRLHFVLLPRLINLNWLFDAPPGHWTLRHESLQLSSALASELGAEKATLSATSAETARLEASIRSLPVEVDAARAAETAARNQLLQYQSGEAARRQAWGPLDVSCMR